MVVFYFIKILNNMQRIVCYVEKTLTLLKNQELTNTFNNTDTERYVSFDKKIFTILRNILRTKKNP